MLVHANVVLLVVFNLWALYFQRPFTLDYSGQKLKNIFNHQKLGVIVSIGH